ncbi:MAG: ABC transporter permease [Dehalococcoidia bacterium]|nr:ABC transporter permease [Dehalococcoidia bacterium]
MAQYSEVSTQPAAVLRTGVVVPVWRATRNTATFAKRFPLGFAGAAILLIVAFLAVAAPVVTVQHPDQVNLGERKETPSWSHPLGTDYNGRDIFSRVVYGGRVSLQVSVLAVLLGTTVGAMWGVASAHAGGRFDIISQRVLEVFMAFPSLVLAMVLLVGIGAGLWTVIIAIAITRLPYGVRVVRSVALSIKETDYVMAARAIGVSNLRMMALHIAPQCIAPFLVLASAHLGVAIIIESSLGFLGVGIPPPTSTWGNMLGGAVANVLIPHWPLVVFPGVAITLVVLGFNFFGDAVRDAFDPRLRGR